MVKNMRRNMILPMLGRSRSLLTCRDTLTSPRAKIRLSILYLTGRTVIRYMFWVMLRTARLSESASTRVKLVERTLPVLTDLSMFARVPNT